MSLLFLRASNTLGLSGVVNQVELQSDKTAALRTARLNVHHNAANEEVSEYECDGSD